MHDASNRNVVWLRVLSEGSVGQFDSGYRAVIFSHLPFNSLTLLPSLLVGRQKEHLACEKLSDEVLAWLSVLSDMQLVQLMLLPRQHLLLQ